MHQKHKVPNYCSQRCYGQVKLGKNENFSRSGKSQVRSLTLSKPGRGGGGGMSYMGYIGMCSCEGYGFQAVYSRIGYINQSVWL